MAQPLSMTTFEELKVKVDAPCAICHHRPPTTTIDVTDDRLTSSTTTKVSSVPVCHDCAARYARSGNVGCIFGLMCGLALGVFAALGFRETSNLDTLQKISGTVILAFIGAVLGLVPPSMLERRRFVRPVFHWLREYAASGGVRQIPS